MTHDPYLEACAAPDAPEIFHSVAHRHDIWCADPFDVEEIHFEAREVFREVLHRLTSQPGVESGRILLIKGESGAGKTHLMRAFRSEAHSRGLGYFGYLQLTTHSENYDRYILSNLVDSLDFPYDEPMEPASGLARICRSLAEADPVRRCRVKVSAGRQIPAVLALTEEDLEPRLVKRLIHHLAERTVGDARFNRIDIDLIRALFYVQTGDPLLKNLALKYIRCEDLSERDRATLGGIVPKCRDEDPARVIEQLGRLVFALSGASLILCVDQLEDIYNLKDAEKLFRMAMGSLRTFTDNVPASLVVIACLEDYYEQLRRGLVQSTVDRIENDPKPVVLTGQRSLEEIHKLVEYRLRFLYENRDLAFDAARPIHPFRDADLKKLKNLRTRDVLDWCRGYQASLRGLAEPVPGSPAAPGDAASRELPDQSDLQGRDWLDNWDRLWNDALSNPRIPFEPLSDEQLAALLAESIQKCAGELGQPLSCRAEGSTVHVEGLGERLLVGVCNKRAQGGGLKAQIEALQGRCRGMRLVIVRSTEFPSNPRTQTALILGRILAQGGRRCVIEDSEWRAMHCFRRFRRDHAGWPRFEDWLKARKPLCSRRSLGLILGLDRHDGTRAPRDEDGGGGGGGGGGEEDVSGEISPEDHRRGAPAPAGDNVECAVHDEPLPEAIVVGRTASGEDVVVETGELIRHVAFLGGTGCGKTTCALHIVEQLLLRGIPALFVDRKGDLCVHARERLQAGTGAVPSRDATPAETGDGGDGAQAAMLRRLWRRADVHVYTPGHPQGRPLKITLLPRGTESLGSFDVDRLAALCANSLCGMLGYGHKGRDLNCRGILKTALVHLCQFEEAEKVSLRAIIDLLEDMHPGLLVRMSSFDNRLFRRLAQDLTGLELNKSHLFASGSPALEIDALLGLGAHTRPNTTRLSVISTQFLGGKPDIEFWVAQLLVELTRWIARNPSPRLQAVVLFDEADIYLPALSRPATKEPMEDLLKRARSAGLGVMLATQSPGDMDYKCRDNIRAWFLGRIKEQTALNKLKPMFQACRVDPVQGLPGQAPGRFHLVREGSLERIEGRLSLVAPKQVPEEEILRIAHATARRGR